jgi:signal transduction histidine kinase
VARRVRYDGQAMARRIVRTLLLSVLFGIALGSVLSANRDGSLADMVAGACVATLYSFAIGLPITIAFDFLGPRFKRWTSLRRWIVYIAVITSSSVVGTLVAGLIIVAADLQTLDEMWQGYLRGLEIALAISIPMTMGVWVVVGLRRKLEDSEESRTATERERERAVALATEARLASLESRVRPHFLFNALNSAIALIPEDPRRAEKLLERLAGLLRYSLDAHSGTVALGEELAVVTDYLEIERVRFGDRLRYDIDVPDELRPLRIPAFAVQTLVENSVKHAVSANKAATRVAVKARSAGDRLVLEIADDGPGFTGPVWIAGHGLDGLRARLDALYGPGARLIAPAPATAGAAVTIEVPAR